MQTKVVIERIIAAREKAGLDLSQAAIRLKCDRTTLSKKEAGKRRIYLEDLLEFSTAYNCPVKEFFASDA